MFLIVITLFTLSVLWNRERVKRLLGEKGCRVVSVRWRPFAWWAPLRAQGFNTVFVDILGHIHKAQCWTHGPLTGLHWHTDEIIGREEFPAP